MAKASVRRYYFTHPGNIGVYGKTQSGKTTLIFDLIRNRDIMFRDKNDDPVSYKSVWVFHGVASQPLYEKLQVDVPTVTFYRSFPTEPIEEIIREENRLALIFIDDQEELLQISGENKVKNLVNRDCHHLDMLVIMSFQSLFPRGNESLNIQRQFDVYIFMTFPGNNNIKLKLEKILGERKLANLIVKIWRKWTGKRGGYMLIDLHLDKLEAHENVLAWNKILPRNQDDEDSPRLLMKKFRR